MILTAALALVAFFYASVGHAGASGYIAVLALAGWPVVAIKPLALMQGLKCRQHRAGPGQHPLPDAIGDPGLRQLQAFGHALPLTARRAGGG